MNDELKTKIREIQDELVTETHNSQVKGDSFDFTLRLIERSIAQIGQAYKESGLITDPFFLSAADREVTMMTGHFWYNRFTQELEKLDDGWTEGTGAVLRGGIEIAAKRATGLESDND